MIGVFVLSSPGRILRACIESARVVLLEYAGMIWDNMVVAAPMKVLLSRIK